MKSQMVTNQNILSKKKVDLKHLGAQLQSPQRQIESWSTPNAI